MKKLFPYKIPTSFIFLAFVCYLFPIAFLLLPQNARAHPHVFVVQQFEVLFDDQGLAGIKVRWKFDDMFASMIGEDYDRNRNGKLEPEEISIIEKEAFSYIADFSYFVFIKIDKKPFPVKYIRDFNAILENRELTYEFLIPCQVTATNRFKKISVAGYDPTYYTAMFFSDNHPVLYNSIDAFEIKTTIQEDPDTKIYFDMIHPWTLFFEFRKKP